LRMFENRVLRRIFGRKREEVAGSRRRYHSTDFIRMIKSRRLRWACHVPCTGESNVYEILVGKSEEKRILGRSRRRWGIILQHILEKYSGKMWIGFIWLRIGTSGGLVNTVMICQVR